MTTSLAADQLPTYDVTARKVHQWAMVLLVAVATLLGGPSGALALAAAGLVMLLGRFWWPADVVRQVVWRVLEPRGLVRRRDVHEDRATRRIARVLGGAAWLGSAVLLVSGMPGVAWVLAWAIAGMVALDAWLDFCVLCFIFLRLERLGWLPPSLLPGAHRLVEDQ